MLRRKAIDKSFDKLRTNGSALISFVVSLSNHKRNQSVQDSLNVSHRLVKKPYQPCPNLHHQTGLTLIELIISMVIIAIALVGIFSVINLTVSHSADPVVQHQAIAIAEAYLEEIQLQAYTDPNGTNTGETRATYDNVDDYNGLNEAPLNQNGAAITSLSAYTVSVAVADQAVTGLTATAKKITVTASGPGVSGTTLVGYRFDY
jgi:MSHA pilin protein MshD